MSLITLTQENFDGIIDNNEIVVIDFWAQWCAPCLSFAPIYEQIANQNPEIIFGKINTEEQQELAAEFNIRSIPTIMILRHKIVVFSESGILPANALQDLINQAKALDMEKIFTELHQDKT